LVEFYDLRQDPVKIYFSEKIQILIADMKNLHMIKQKGKNSKNPSKGEKYREWVFLCMWDGEEGIGEVGAGLWYYDLYWRLYEVAFMLEYVKRFVMRHGRF
jgi:hypothetical protein